MHYDWKTFTPLGLVMLVLTIFATRIEAQTEHVIDVTMIPTTPATPDNPNDDDRAGIQAAIAEAKTYITSNPDDTVKIWLPAGSSSSVYHITSTTSSDRNLLLQNAHKIRFVGAPGVTLRFTNRQAFGIMMYDCSSISIENLTFEYETRPFTQGTITSIGTGTISFSVESGYPDPTSDTFFDITIPSSHESAIQAFDPNTRLIKRESGQLSASNLSSDPITGDVVVTLKSSSVNPSTDYNYAIGDLVTLKGAPNGGVKSMIYASRCTDLTLKDLTIHEATSTGITNTDCADVTIDSCHIVPKGDSLLSSNRGAIRNGQCRGNLKVENCVIDRCGDDGITTPSRFAVITSPSSTKVLEADDDVGVIGGEIEIFDVTNHASKGTRTLTARTPSTTNPGAYDYELDAAISVDVGDVIQPNSQVALHFEIKNNSIRRHRARGLLLKSSYGIADNNFIDGSTYGGIVLGPELSHFIEAGFVRDVCITNNTIRNVGHAKSAASASNTFLGAITVAEKGNFSTWPTGRENQRVLIEGNRVIGAGMCGLFLGSVSGAEIKNNLFLNCQLYPSSAAGTNVGVPQSTTPMDSPIYVIETEDLQFSDNRIEFAEGDPWIRSVSSDAHDHARNRHVLFYSFEEDEGWTQVNGATTLSSVPSAGGSAVMTASDFKLIGNNSTHPYYIDRQAARCDVDEGYLMFEVNNPRTIHFAISSNTSTASTWHCVVSIESLDGTTLSETDLLVLENSVDFHSADGKAPNFLNVDIDIDDELGHRLPSGRYKIKVARRNITSDGSPYMYIDDIGVSYDAHTTRFQDDVEDVFPEVTSYHNMTGTWAPTELSNGLELAFENWGLIGSNFSVQSIDGQGSRCQVQYGTLTIENVVDPALIGFQFAVSDPSPSPGSNEIEILYKLSSASTWTSLANVSTFDMAGNDPWEFSHFEFPLTLSSGTYDLRVIRNGAFTTAVYNYICLDNLFLSLGTEYTPHAYPCPPWN